MQLFSLDSEFLYNEVPRSPKNVTRWVGTNFRSMKTPLLILSVVDRTRRWGCLSVSSGSLMRSISTLRFLTML